VASVVAVAAAAGLSSDSMTTSGSVVAAHHGERAACAKSHREHPAGPRLATCSTDQCDCARPSMARRNHYRLNHRRHLSKTFNRRDAACRSIGLTSRGAINVMGGNNKMRCTIFQGGFDADAQG